MLQLIAKFSCMKTLKKLLWHIILCIMDIATCHKIQFTCYNTLDSFSKCCNMKLERYEIQDRSDACGITHTCCNTTVVMRNNTQRTCYNIRLVGCILQYAILIL